jgi:hypothetical protein
VSISASLAVLAIGSYAWAASGSEYELKATPKHPNAQGTAVISDTDISVHAKGLKPDSVYTIWFVNMKPNKSKTGAGQAPYMFKTDANGNGSYTSTLSASPVGKWQVVMVVLHPNGDPTDMKHMVGALSAKL